jgi:Phage integrase family
VFTAEDSGQLHPKRTSALFARLVRAAALPQIPLHGLRHTYASLALAKGVNAAIVSRRLGHSTVAFTLDIYSHVLPQVDPEAAEFIASFSSRWSEGSHIRRSAPHCRCAIELTTNAVERDVLARQLGAL